MHSMNGTYPHAFSKKPRIFILTDISNEPDDAESLVRYLLYSNQFHTEGLVAVTSTWMPRRVCPHDIDRIVSAYAGAVDNLNAHVHQKDQYPSAEYLKSLIRSGPPVYGMAAIGDEFPLSDGAQLLIERIEAELDQPLWVLVWGGTNVLAQALFTLQKTHSAEEAVRLRANLRVYTISDQDDTSAWIRHQFPDVFYISSVHAWNQYGLAAWTGISGERWYKFDPGGPDPTKVSKQWIKKNIQIGPLGSAYPNFLVIPEGDTPTFLYLIQNGLGVSEHPDYGSWGGRYGLVDSSPSGLKSRHYSDVKDCVIGLDGRKYMSNQATVWRWRDAFQNDFAARIQWTMTNDFSKANHAPVICINGSTGLEPVYVEQEAGSSFTLDASTTYDPDENDTLTFKWFHYREPTATQWSAELEVPELSIKKLDDEGRKVEVQIPGPEMCCVELLSRIALARGQLLHLILEVKDNGLPPLVSYRRILIQTTNKDLRGGGQGGEAIGDVMAAILGED